MSKLSKRHVLGIGSALLAGYGALWTTSGPARQPVAEELPEPVTLVLAPSAPVPRASPKAVATPPPPAAAEPEPAEIQAETEPAFESQLADWMLAAIRGEEWDRARTEVASAELSAALTRLPDLHAQELECGKRFCRALLVDRRGQPAEIQPLIGAPPFDGEGFTTHGETGKAEIFFTRAGQSLDGLRDEARL